MWLLLPLSACVGDTAIFLSIEGQVLDFTDQSGVADASLTFEDETGAPIGEAVTDASGDWRATLVVPYDRAAGAELFSVIDHPDFAATTAHQRLRFRDFSGASAGIRPGHRANAQIIQAQPLLVAPASDVDGTVAGKVFDAVVPNQAAGVPGLALEVREGLDAPLTHPLIAAGTTGAGGDFRFDGLPAGTYTVDIDGGDVWADARFAVVSVGGALTGDQNGATSVALDEDQFRVVLSWGESPWDVDSHLSGPMSTTDAPDAEFGARFHVYYGAKEYPAGSGASGALVFLDVDDTSSFGPETITVRRSDPGLYKYVLHDYTNKSSDGSDALSYSRSKVQLFAGSRAIETWYIPTGRAGTIWTAFEIDGDTLEPYTVSQYGAAESPTDPQFY